MLFFSHLDPCFICLSSPLLSFSPSFSPSFSFSLFFPLVFFPLDFSVPFCHFIVFLPLSIFLSFDLFYSFPSSPLSLFIPSSVYPSPPVFVFIPFPLYLLFLRPILHASRYPLLYFFLYPLSRSLLSPSFIHFPSPFRHLIALLCINDCYAGILFMSVLRQRTRNFIGRTVRYRH